MTLPHRRSVARSRRAPLAPRPGSAPAFLALFGGALLLAIMAPQEVAAGGFEVPENVTASLAMGGTGVALKDDPSALYFNPALIPRSRGFQLLINSNFVDMDVSFKRSPLIYERGDTTYTREFDEVSNQRGWFPAPLMMATWDLGIENFALAFGIYGPSAYGGTCYGEVDEEGECRLRRQPDAPEGTTTFQDPNGARHMMLESELLQVYFTLGAGYTFDLGEAELGLGVSASAVYQRTSFGIVVDADTFDSGAPWPEDPDNEAIFRASDLTDWRPTGMFGLSYRRGGLHLGASYRPPILWRSTGTAELDLPAAQAEASGARLTDTRVDFQTWQAGTMRLGVGYTRGEHPRFSWRPKLSLAADVVWEDWSRTETFSVTPAGDLELTELGITSEIQPLKQEKRWQDTYSLRLGAKLALSRWLSVSGGGYMETPTQSNAYTNVDFVSWERYGVGGGATFHLSDWIDLDVGYMHVFMPDRRVTDGEFYHSVPLSECAGPDYNDPSCPSPGQPPGNPQNNGEWSARYRTASAGFTLHFDRDRHGSAMMPATDPLSEPVP